MNNLQGYSVLLESYNELISSQTGKRLQQYADLLERFKDVLKTGIGSRRRDNFGFNPLTLLNVKYDELTHSNILGWVLDGFGSHGQGDLFFKAFIKQFNITAPYFDMEYRVLREYAASESIVDLLIYGKNFIIYIENKTLSKEGFQQTFREYRDMQRLANALKIGNKNQTAVFLSPQGMEAKHPHWMQLSYLQLAEMVDSCLDQVESSYVQFFLQSWTEILREVGV